MHCSQMASFRGLDSRVSWKEMGGAGGGGVMEANLDVWQELKLGLNSCKGNEVGVKGLSSGTRAL